MLANNFGWYNAINNIILDNIWRSSSLLYAHLSHAIPCRNPFFVPRFLSFCLLPIMSITMPGMWMLNGVWPRSFTSLHSTLQMVSTMLDFATSMRPDFHRAVIDTISYYGWKNIIYFYHSYEGKSIILSCLK